MFILQLHEMKVIHTL